MIFNLTIYYCKDDSRHNFFHRFTHTFSLSRLWEHNVRILYKKYKELCRIQTPLTNKNNYMQLWIWMCELKYLLLFGCFCILHGSEIPRQRSHGYMFSCSLLVQGPELYSPNYIHNTKFRILHNSRAREEIIIN